MRPAKATGSIAATALAQTHTPIGDRRGGQQIPPRARDWPRLEARRRP